MGKQERVVGGAVPAQGGESGVNSARPDDGGVAPREPGRNKRSEETIRTILAAAEQVILESGVERVGIQEVCDVAGLSRGTFYRYFSSQEELLDAFTQHKRDMFHRALRNATEPYGDPDERFAALLAYLDEFLKRSKARRLLAVAPAYAFGFLQRAFVDSLERFQLALAIVFDAWDERLGVKLDRELVCELLIRYVLSELLVEGDSKRHLLPERIASLIASIGQGRKEDEAVKVKAPGARLEMAPDVVRSRRSDQTIGQILAAAEEIILESGVERVSILAVCEAAGVSRGTFYRYFKSQDELLDAFTEHQRLQFHQSLMNAAAEHEEPEARFGAVMEHMDYFLRRDKVRRLLEIAPEYAFGFFQRTFDDAIERFESVLDIVFDSWEDKLDARIDRHLACEMLVRYMLSELLVPTEKRKPLLPLQLGKMFSARVAQRRR
jgi:AcrR family transcriptional regulator